MALSGLQDRIRRAVETSVARSSFLEHQVRRVRSYRQQAIRHLWLTFESAPLLSKGDSGKADWAGVLIVDEGGAQILMTADGHELIAQKTFHSAAGGFGGARHRAADHETTRPEGATDGIGWVVDQGPPPQLRKRAVYFRRHLFEGRAGENEIE